MPRARFRPPSTASPWTHTTRACGGSQCRPRGASDYGTRCGQGYQQLRNLLGNELGLEPERATRALYHELLGQR
ncbi:MAG: BTAD domain-containing putative transcriptional regulator [Solirubrobacteraceae bacterium]